MTLGRFPKWFRKAEPAPPPAPAASANLLQQAFALYQKGRLAQAAALCRELLAQAPNHFDALHLSAVIEVQSNNPSAALELFDRAIAVNPNSAEVYTDRGAALRGLKRFEEELASYDRAIAIKPDYVIALLNRGAALRDLKRQEEALKDYDRALAIQPDLAEAHSNRGNALRDLGRPQEALASYEHALAIQPDHARALSNRGNVLQDLKRPEDALKSYDRALLIKPDYAEAYANRGVALRELNRPQEALKSYDRALAIKPGMADALNNRGVALGDLRRLEEALASYDRALILQPDYPEALNNRGAVLRDLKRHAEALVSYGRALAIKPDHPYLFGEWLHTKMQVCDWSALGDCFRRLAAGIESGQRISPPFPLLATPLSLAQQRKCAELYVQGKYSANPILSAAVPKRQDERIRIGYFSADLRNHAVAFLTAGLFERHNRARFELTAFSFGPSAGDPMRTRLEAAFDKFLDVRNMSDGDVALLARSHGIDIAVDLGGFTADSRTGIFALRPAPLQVNYLGYPGTLGAACMDYIIGDQVLIPETDRDGYAEKVVYLPHTFQANDSSRKISAAPSRNACGLPDSAFVFCSFNASYKLNPAMFDIWLRLLGKVDGSVLWLVGESQAQVDNLRAWATNRGVSPERLIFASRVPYADHLARYRIADLVLDTLPFNGGTTTSDALWGGAPVVTCVGETFAGRMAASLLNAVGLPQLIARSLAEYETLAQELAADPQRLSAIRKKLSENRTTHPLFDTGRFAKHLESAYVTMWQRHQAGQAPDHIHVQAWALLSQTSSARNA